MQKTRGILVRKALRSVSFRSEKSNITLLLIRGTLIVSTSVAGPDPDQVFLGDPDPDPEQKDPCNSNFLVNKVV